MKKLVKILSALLSVLLLAQFVAVGASARADDPPPELYDFLIKAGITDTDDAADLALAIEGLGINPTSLKAYMKAWDDAVLDPNPSPGPNLAPIPPIYYDYVDTWVDGVFNGGQAVTFMRQYYGSSFMAARLNYQTIKQSFINEVELAQQLSVAVYAYFLKVADDLRGAFTGVTEYDQAGPWTQTEMIRSILRYYFFVLTGGDLAWLLEIETALYDFLLKVGIPDPEAATLALDIERMGINTTNLKAHMISWYDAELVPPQIPSYTVGPWVDSVFMKSSGAAAFMRDSSEYSGSSFMAVYFDYKTIKSSFTSYGAPGEQLSVACYDYFRTVANDLRYKFTEVMGRDNKADLLEDEARIKSVMCFYFYMLTGSGDPEELCGDLESLYVATQPPAPLPVDVLTSTDLRETMYYMLNDAMGLGLLESDIETFLPVTVGLDALTFATPLWLDARLDPMKNPVMDPDALGNIGEYVSDILSESLGSDAFNDNFIGIFEEILGRVDILYPSNTAPLGNRMLAAVILLTELVLVNVNRLEFTMIAAGA